MTGAILLAMALAAAQPAPTPTPAPAPADDAPVESQELEHEVLARSAVDRTAMWVGDPLMFTVRIVCAPGIDVLDDDLAGDKLKLDGLEFVSLDSTREGGPAGATVRTFRYHVTTYNVEQTTLTIAPMTARYYRVRPGTGVEGGEAAGEVAIPGAVVAFRSMLPDQMETSRLRDGRASGTRARQFAVAGPVGTGLLIASVVPVLIWTVAAIRERRPKTERRSKRKVKREERTSLESVRALDVDDPEGRRDAYTKISQLVRGHLHDVLDVPGPALTPAEIEPALAAHSGRVPADAIRALLAECDGARYAPPSALPPADACRAAIDEASNILSGRA
jgi:hypothetical protein